MYTSQCVHAYQAVYTISLLREEGRSRVGVEVPREEAVDQLSLQESKYICLPTFLLHRLLRRPLSKSDFMSSPSFLELLTHI